MAERVEDAIERYFSGELRDPVQRDALFRRLERSREHRARFDELARAQRLLTGTVEEAPATELALIGDAVIDEVVAGERRPRRSWRWIWGALAPVAAVVLAFVVLPMPWKTPGTLTAKGGKAPVSPTVEVLCFDLEANVVAHLKGSGRCPAPGLVKLVYAAATTVPALTVAVLSDDRTVLLERMEEPRPRSVLPEHVRLGVGDELRVVLLEGTDEVSDETLRGLPPTLTIVGVTP